jgi:ParB-like nuclease domain
MTPDPNSSVQAAPGSAAPAAPGAQPAPWPAEQLERRPLAVLIPAARNARTHSQAQVAALAASIREWGWTMPILIDEAHNIIAGHGRVLAAEVLGVTDVPVIVARGWTPAQKRAYALADNKLALNAGWDLEMLRLEITDLRSLAVDVTALGFSTMEIDQLFAAEADQSTEWRGMPEFVQEDASAFQSIVVHFKDAEAVQTFAQLIGQRLGPTSRFTWFPHQERAHFRDQHYVSGEGSGNA